MRQIVLDTETTGLDPAQGHRIIEIGCVEMVERRLTGRNFHQYLQPDREIDKAAEEVHGISNAFLADKPRFGDVVVDLMDFLRGAELIIHNAPFDVGFLNHELQRLPQQWQPLQQLCEITDTLALAKRIHPGQRNSLDALCKRYDIDNSQRELHGALLDSEILAEVYLAMTGGQAALLLDSGEDAAADGVQAIRRVAGERAPLAVIRASGEELALHRAALAGIDRASGGNCLWKGES
ncbi:MAG: DNA polymerase III subunit epsilon [Gammaproteobacteria bacterium]|nr:DNA polymerase III subunit epsilon [Gammaproteobacteria bacterium]